MREAKRVYERYAVEFVEALGVCPWAMQARRDGATRVEVDLAAVPGAATEAQLTRLSEEPEVMVALVLFPRARLGRKAWEREVSRVREGLGAGAPFALAAFHPEAMADVATAARLVPFIRRTPDPTIQAVRYAALEGLRRHESTGSRFLDPATLDLGALMRAGPPRPALHERVAEMNLTNLEAFGLRRAEAVLDAILTDRRRSYP